MKPLKTDAETSVRDAKETNERINKNIEAHLVGPRPGRVDMNMPGRICQIQVEVKSKYESCLNEHSYRKNLWNPPSPKRDTTLLAINRPLAPSSLTYSSSFGHISPYSPCSPGRPFLCSHHIRPKTADSARVQPHDPVICLFCQYLEGCTCNNQGQPGDLPSYSFQMTSFTGPMLSPQFNVKRSPHSLTP